MESESVVKYFYIAAVLGAIILAFFIFKPFIITLLTAMVIAYIFHPVYKALDKRVKRKHISAAIVSILIIIVFTAPAVLLVNAASKEAYTTYLIYKQRLAGKNILNMDCEGRENLFCQKYNQINEFITTNPKAKFYFSDTISKLSAYVMNKVEGFLISTPLLFLHALILLFAVYFLFVDGESLIRKAEAVIPIKVHHKEKLIKKFQETSKVLVYGQVLIAVLEGFMGGLGFFLFGISSPIFWGAVITILALIPIIGASVVWVPASLLMIIDGVVSGSAMLMWKGIALAAYCLIFVSSIETLLKPKIIGSRTGIHPLLVLLSALGGVNFFGIIGFFIGPLVIVLLLDMLEIYEKETRVQG